jgi:hypothetical protein
MLAFLPPPDPLGSANVAITATALIVIQCIKRRTKRHTGKDSPLFFATIAETPHEEFKGTMQVLTPNRIIAPPSRIQMLWMPESRGPPRCVQVCPSKERFDLCL